ncbi:MAG TPA: hypothetical protein VGT03_07275 [Candidatus Acidoferrales bacterium]|nr:hypothetical protein [Candidatus Acidoferrales bacterium]
MTTRTQPLAPEAHPPIRRRPRPNPGRHARKCAICNHPRRDEIEGDFFRWDDPVRIYEQYGLPSVSALYRHAQATGLLARRRRNLRGVAERVLENVDDAKVSGSTILRAMRIFAHVTEDGQWLEPPKESLVTHIHKFEQPASASPVSNNSQPVSAPHGLNGSVENKSLSASPEEILIGNESVSRGESSD